MVRPVMTRTTITLVAAVTLAAAVAAVTAAVEGPVERLRARRPLQMRTTRQLYVKLSETDGLTVDGDLTYRADRNKSKAAVRAMRTAHDQFHDRLAKGVHALLDSLLRSYNKIAANFLQTYAISEQDDKNLDKMVPAIGFKDEATQKYAFLAFLNDSRRDVGGTMDNLLLYASMVRSHKQQRYRHNVLAAAVNKFPANQRMTDLRFVHDLNADTNNVTEALKDKEKAIDRLSSVFEDTGEFAQWLQIFDRNKRFLSKHLEKYARLMYEMSCELTIKKEIDKKEVSKTIEQWNCNQDMTGNEHDYGFMSYDFEKDSEKEKSTKKKTTGSTSISDADNLDLTIIDNHSKLSDWVVLYRNANNVLVFNNIQLELYVNTVGLMSGTLMQGTKHILQRYCVQLTEKDAARAVEHVEFARSYLVLFERLVTRMVVTIGENLNVDTSKNPNLVRMQRKLSKMIAAIQVRKYEGETEFQKMQNMKTAVETDFQPLRLIKEKIDVLKVKTKFIIRPVKSLFEFIELLVGRPKISEPSSG